MLEILKFLAGQVSGIETLGMVSMILTYMACTSVVINSLFFCVGVIIFIYISYLVAQIYLAKYNKDNIK